MSQYYSKLANGSINITYPNKYVGIGTTNPDGKLHIYEGNLKFTTATNATIANISFVRESSNNGMMIQGFETYLAFNTFGGGAGEIMRLTRADGYVGIGTTNPSHALDISGNTRISGNLHMGTSSATTSVITLYGDGQNYHSISSRNSLFSVADDIRINTYGALYINLDSNNNNTSGADFMIGRHGGVTTISDWFFTLNGESGNAVSYTHLTLPTKA